MLAHVALLAVAFVAVAGASPSPGTGEESGSDKLALDRGNRRSDRPRERQVLEGGSGGCRPNAMPKSSSFG